MDNFKKIIAMLKTVIVMLFITLGLSTATNFYLVPETWARGFSTPNSFSQLAEEVSPAVVNIRTVKTIKGGGYVFRHFPRPFGDNDPFKDFFEKFFGEEHQKDYKQRSLGSGFIIDKEGYIVTNNHVIEDADEIQVKLKKR